MPSSLRPASRLVIVGAILVASLLLVTGARAAAAQSGDTLGGESTGATAANLQGYVVTGGIATSWYFAYANASSAWCTSYGASGAATNTTATETASSDGLVSADVAGLTPGATYCYELMVVTSASTTGGGIQSVVVGLPAALTDDVSSTGAGTATVDGEVDPSGQATTYAVAYDTDGSAWCLSAGESGSPTFTTATQSADPADGDDQWVSVDLSGLTAGTEYCAALVATNGSGSDTGTTMEFLDGAPGAQLSGDVAVTGDTTATVDGEVDPAGQTTSYAVEYDTADSDWCTSEGLSGVPYLTTASTLSSDDDPSDVAVGLGGLLSGTDYCAELLAINNSASQSSTMATFTTTGTAAPADTGTTSTGATTTSTTSTTTTTTATTTTKTPTTVAPKPVTKPTSTGTSSTTGTKQPPATGSSAPTKTEPTNTTPTNAAPSTSANASKHGPAAAVATPTYALALAKSHSSRSAKVRVSKRGTLELKLTAVRATTVTITATVPGPHGRRHTVRVARVSVASHATCKIFIQLPKSLRRALPHRTVRLTASGR